MPGSSRLARLLQASCLLQLSVAAACLAWRWPASPVQAVALALLVPLLAPLVLGLELLMVRRLAPGDSGVPVPSAADLLRAWRAETAHWFRTFWWRQPFRWRALDDHLPQAPSSGPPLVFIHGFMCNRGFWTPWMQQCRHRGLPYLAVNLEPVFASIDDYAPLIEAAVARVEALGTSAPVLVCHSMGGIAARAWWARHGRPGRVARIVTIGSPHGGTWLARFSHSANGRQMRLGSPWLAGIAQQEARQGRVPITCWYSNCDNVVFPASTATLSGADNRFVPGQPHVGLAFHPRVLDETLSQLQAAPPSR